MTSIRSHFRQTPKQGDTTASKSRIPTKLGAVDVEKPQKPAHSPAKLLKKQSSRNINLSEQRAGKIVSPSNATPHSLHNNSLRDPRPGPVAAQSSTSLSSHRFSSSSALPVPPAIRTPSLISGSSLSTIESPKSSGLRRKASGAIDRYVAQRRAGSEGGSTQEVALRSRDVFDDAVLGISIPHVAPLIEKPTNPELTVSTYHRYQTPVEELPLRGPTPSTYASSATPSTRYTDSPFSHAPTPSSVSSYSPSLVGVSGPSFRPRPSSPTRSRLPMTGKVATKDSVHRQSLTYPRDVSTPSVAQGSRGNTTTTSTNLAPVRELSTSSSGSNATRVASEQPLNKAHTSHPNKSSETPARAPAQIPPELAHLNVDAPTPITTVKLQPPQRPSRDGISDIAGMEHQSRVVQSDLPLLYTTYHKRTPSQETATSSASPSIKARFGFSPKSSSLRGESPRIDSAISPPPATQTFSRGSTPDLASDTASLSRRDSPAIIPASPSKRFGFFSRKPKPEAPKTTEKPRRGPVKGPVAGTGHEGYGRFGIRGRSGSSNSITSVRSPSTDSTGSTAVQARPTAQSSHASKASTDRAEMDDFFKQRLNPVILRGSGTSITRTESAPDISSTVLQPVSSSTSSLNGSIQPQLLPSALQKSTGVSPSKRPPTGRRRPSDSSDDGIAIRYPTRFNRASLNRTSLTSSTSSARVPPSLEVAASRRKQSQDSYDTDASALTRTDSEQPLTDDSLHGREGLWLRSNKPESTTPARKLNFLQRALATPRPKGKERAIEPKARRDSSARSSTSGTPYAILDPVHKVELHEVGRMLAEAETSTEESATEVHAPALMVPYENRHVSLLPAPRREHAPSINPVPRNKLVPPKIKVPQMASNGSPELLRAKPVISRQSAQLVNIARSPSLNRPQNAVIPDYNAVAGAENSSSNQAANGSLSTPELPSCHSPKPPRLSPVGRIPKVVSKRDRDRKLSDNSFSRPFARHQPRPSSVKPPGSVYTQIREMASPIESASQPNSSTSTQSTETAHEQTSSVSTQPTTTSTTRTSMDIFAPDEFLAMPRKGSDVSFSTSSGHPSWLYFQPQQEDIWNEYNDFIDEVMPTATKTFPKPPSSAGSSLGAPFQYADVLKADKLSAAEPYPYYIGPAPTMQLPMLPGSMPVSSPLSIPQQITQMLHPSLSPMTPEMIMSLIGGYDNRASSYASHRASLPAAPSANTRRPSRSSLVCARESMSSSRYSQLSTHSRMSSLPEANTRMSQVSMASSHKHSREGILQGIPEQGDAAVKLANLRRGAILVSKQLLKDRFFISPAQNDMKFSDEPRVLIIDGISGDWSHFVALTHPMATVYNFDLTGKSNGQKQPETQQSFPANYREIPQTSIAGPFPFPKGFFTAVVLRFLPASSEEAYHACISECKRVLRPGGYLELAAVDVDLTHMSTKARKALRDLKTRMQHNDRDVCLQNVSDVFLRLIGRRGFENVQRYMTAVPTTSRQLPSREGSGVSSIAGSDNFTWQRDGRRNAGLGFDLTDLLQNSFHTNQMTQSAASKQAVVESVDKFASKVGRWWYSSCYERATLPGHRSIWAEPSLLRECDHEGTMFRMFVCHAQKPSQIRRRTVSV